MAKRRIYRDGATIGLCIAVFAAVGCGSELKVNPEAYRGPGLSYETADAAYMLVAQTPTPGWEVELDAMRPGPDSTDVYVTLRQPNPVAGYRIDPMTQRVLTRVATDRPLGIIARVMPYGSDEDRPYRRVDTPRP